MEHLIQKALRLYSSNHICEAESILVKVVDESPDQFPALQILAAIRRHQDRPEEALELLFRAVAINPDSAELHNSLANTLSSLKRYQEAVKHFHTALALRADFSEAHFNLANCLKESGQYEQAASAYSAVTALRPDYVAAHTNLGIVLDRLHRPDEALASFARALALDPQSKHGYGNVGLALVDCNRHEEALPFLRRSKELQPESALPTFDEALVHLALGNFAAGWPGYEARWTALPGVSRPPFLQPMWNGQMPLGGKTILLYAEQGLGDTILFARYVHEIVNQGARTILAVPEALVELMASIPGVADVITSTDPVPDFDVHAPLGSLPMLFSTTIETIPSQTPYLAHPSSEMFNGLRESSDSSLLVGVCWAGNPNYVSDSKRSVPISSFQRLFSVSGVRFVSLQKDLRNEDASVLLGFPGIDLTSVRRSQGLADTAALISQLDLVVTVDTVIAHLAGALGRPVWILLRYSGYWVWLLKRPDSPWYPTARLFRQEQPGNWDAVLDDAILHLTFLANGVGQKRAKPLIT